MTWEEVVGQDKAIGKVRALAKRGIGGRAYWISGGSGTGKTTIARLIARELAESWNVEEIDAQDVGIDTVREMERGFTFMGMGCKTGKAWIINEAHGLRGQVISRLLTCLEPVPEHCTVIFTTTNDGEESLFEDFDTPPFLSRCTRIKLASRGLAEAFAKRAAEIADKEGLNGRELPWYLELVRQSRNNMRAVLQAIEGGAAME